MKLDLLINSRFDFWVIVALLLFIILLSLVFRLLEQQRRNVGLLNGSKSWV